jgi:hypothetical protein
MTAAMKTRSTTRGPTGCWVAWRGLSPGCRHRGGHAARAGVGHRLDYGTASAVAAGRGGPGGPAASRRRSGENRDVVRSGHRQTSVVALHSPQTVPHKSPRAEGPCWETATGPLHQGRRSPPANDLQRSEVHNLVHKLLPNQANQSLPSLHSLREIPAQTYPGLCNKWHKYALEKP